jgi:hypothetical protein
MRGALRLGDQEHAALLTDGNADGCFGTAGVDRIWIDLNDDGRFDPVAERFPLGTAIAVDTPHGSRRFTIASDPWARRVSAHERDTRLGRLELVLQTGHPSDAGAPATALRIESLAAKLVGKTGELVVFSALDRPQEVPVESYRIDSFELRALDDAGRAWSYDFAGGSRATITVEPHPARPARAGLLDGLALEVAAGHGVAHPGDSVDITPTLRLGSGLYLSNCWTQRTGSSIEQPRTAAIVLHDPGGQPRDRAVTGFL